MLGTGIDILKEYRKTCFSIKNYMTDVIYWVNVLEILQNTQNHRNINLENKTTHPIFF